ncbi:hypothetical protein [Actinokineospora enzanensis]|uniref:glycan biosynthesis hexose transferase WsfD n=1 Tax=Actinokineospora enzanensis TaxID=155975 RepID=UPI000367224B|nr:hypothetical protein [Actinokineospora enzanensis]
MWKRWVPTGTFVLWLTAIGIRWLLPVPIGIADNGDGWRLICKLGLGTSESSAVLEGSVRLFYPTGSMCPSDYISSQFWIDRFAIWVGGVLGMAPGLHLLLVGAICAVLVALSLTVITHSLPARPIYRVLAGILIALVALDSAFFGYFTSILSEGAVFVGILLVCAGMLLLRRDGLARWFGAALVAAGGVIGVNAKSQTLLVLPLLVLAMLAFILWDRRRGLARWALPVMVIFVVGAGTAALQGTGDLANEDYREANAYHAIFDSILDGKHDTYGDLAALGLPAHFAEYIGTGFWSARPATKDPDYPKYRDKISNHNILRYYSTHPLRTWQILDVGASNMLAARVPNLGNFPMEAGQGWEEKEYRVPVLSGPTALVAPLGFYVVIPLWLLIAYLGIRALRGRDRGDLGILILMLLGVAMSELVLASLAEGVEGVKHQNPALFATLLGLMFGIISLLPRASIPEEDPATSADQQEQNPTPATT